jgi:sarcosine oxidase subunit alpha
MPRQREYAHCDVAVIGAGVSGLSAALAAAEAGARRVVLVEESQQAGGRGLWQARTRSAEAARCRELIAAVRAGRSIELHTCSSVVGCYADNELAISRIDREDGGLTLLRAAAVVLATGCIEQPAVFRNNDLPGILLGSAAQRLLYRYGISVGERIAILGANEEAVALALDLASHGLAVTDLIVPTGAPLSGAALPEVMLRAAGVRVHAGVAGIAAQSAASGALAGVELSGSARAQNLESIAVIEQIQHEDVAICASVQRGLHSRAYTAGRLSVRREAGEHLFHRLLYDDLSAGLP